MLSKTETGDHRSRVNKAKIIIWDMKIQTDKILEHSRPDIVILEKNSRSCLIVDVSCPFDTRVLEKEREKIDRYQDLKWELQRIWECREVRVIPIVIGALGTISKGFHHWLKETTTPAIFRTLQKACLLGTARILRYALNI